jgi:lipoprotein signal peptidase|tara:strand:+ start:1532 stop:1708 length:177 start_codon:yes stop_codon:yes gene_type:complete
MKEALFGIVITLLLIVVLLFVQPHTWFYHGMICDGGIGGGCDRSTATGGFFKWMGAKQ